MDMHGATSMAGSALPRRRRRKQQQQQPQQARGAAVTTTTTQYLPPTQQLPRTQQPQNSLQGRVRTRARPARARGRGRGAAIYRAPKTESSPGIWWLMGQFQVSSTSPTGPLELMVLHPTTFPDSPYAAQCMHHTHRIERRWELSIEITTATTTGARVAVFALPDPDWNPGTIPPEMVWGSCLNGMGSLATVTGTGQHKSRFVLNTSTRRLSNAVPPTSNYLGYASAVIVVYLLERPLALTGSGAMTVSVMARVSMQVVNPIPGFLSFVTTPTPGPGPEPHPTTQSWSIQIANGKATTNITSTWYNSHVGSAWLAGGIYLKMPSTRPTSGDITVQGEPKAFTVYTSTVQAINWHNNRGTTRTPRYFVLWFEPGSYACQMVGFEKAENAINQAKKETGLVPSGVESCLIYSGTPKSWSAYFTLSATGANTIGFVEYATTAFSQPIYSSSLYDLAARGGAEYLPVRTRQIAPDLDTVVLGEGVGRASPELPSSSPLTQPSPEHLQECLESLEISAPPLMTFTAPLSPLITSRVTSPASCMSPTPCSQDSCLLEDRCDALREDEIAELVQRLKHLTGVTPLLPGVNAVEQSFEIIPKCPGCMDSTCDWCFEDADSEV